MQERRLRQVNTSTPEARTIEGDSLMIPGLGVHNEWDYVKFSQERRLGEMEIFI